MFTCWYLDGSIVRIGLDINHTNLHLEEPSSVLGDEVTEAQKHNSGKQSYQLYLIC